MVAIVARALCSHLPQAKRPELPPFRVHVFLLAVRHVIASGKEELVAGDSACSHGRVKADRGPLAAWRPGATPAPHFDVVGF